ncbi:GNAT family N-acetyltransferase [Rothia sp. SD9660Na]|uniref:GNAT family N-acetyltransferase n=1 Tax=Rothia sp. SD9660Na TaxID=3047030 RepID=UPI0024B8F566|nr:GNAT family N-acetyltransferase [Rothia sp. SD9660Na]WHS51424.1 GNAT family N-acetyltransferase [Rothia sp. SD9660Na]
MPAPITSYQQAEKILAAQLSIDLCLPEQAIDIAQQHGSTHLSARRIPLDEMHPARRRYRDHWELRLINYRGLTVICAQHPRVREAADNLLAGDNGNWVGDYSELRKLNDYLTPYALQMSGTSLFFTPGRDFFTRGADVRPGFPAEGYTVRWLEPTELEQYRGNPDFENALGFKELRPDVQVLGAYTEGELVALAGASEDSDWCRQIGIDVLPGHRSRGLASYLVKELSQAILTEGFVPFYGTSPSHIISQQVALNAGLRPAWWEFVSTSLNEISVD